MRDRAILVSDDPTQSSITLNITGTVKQTIKVEPFAAIMLQGFQGDTIKQNVTISAVEDQTFKITGISTTLDDKIKPKVKTIQKGKAYRLEVQTRGELDEDFKGKVLLTTDYQRKPKIEIDVIGKVQKEVQVAPEYFFFGIIDRSKDTVDPKSLQRTVLINSARGKDLQIEKVESTVDWIAIETITEKEGERYKLVITLRKDQLPKAGFREKINLHTTANKKSEASFIIIDGKVIN